MAEPGGQYEHLALFRGEHWKVGLHPKQTYLGRGVAILDRPLADPLECTSVEHAELWEEVLPQFAELVTEAFQPVRFNFGHMANDLKQVHWHLIPRYEAPAERTFAEVTWTDTNVGRNYSPHPEVPQDCTEETIQAIRAELKTGFPE